MLQKNSRAAANVVFSKDPIGAFNIPVTYVEPVDNDAIIKL